MSAKLVGGLLTLVVLTALALVSFGVPGGGSSAARAPLDRPAQQACEIFAPLAEPVRTRQLTGPSLFRGLQDVFNAARTSTTEGFPERVRTALNAAIVGDEPALDRAVADLQTACAAPVA